MQYTSRDMDKEIIFLEKGKKIMKKEYGDMKKEYREM